MKRINVLMLSIFYPLAICRYWENAFKRNPNIDFVNCGSYTGDWIPWLGGMQVKPEGKYSRPPTYPLPFKPNIVTKVPYALVKAQLPEKWIPDLVITINAGVDWIDKPTDGIVASVGTDSHVLDYDHSRKISDKFFNMHPAHSAVSDILLSYAYDPGTHYVVNDIKKDMDAVLIGMPYAERVEWVNKLREKGVSVLFENGPIFDEYRELNNRAWVALNWASKNDTNARFFEGLAMCLCLVTNRTADIQKYGFVENQHYLGFTSMDEAVEKVLWAKNNPNDANAIALSGYNKVCNENWTYDNLVSKILKECGF